MHLKELVLLARSKKTREATVWTIVCEENQACTSWVTEGGKRNEHIDVCYHVRRKAVNNGKVKLEYRPATDMIASTLTEPLEPQKLKTVLPVSLWRFC